MPKTYKDYYVLIPIITRVAKKEPRTPNETILFSEGDIIVPSEEVLDLEAKIVYEVKKGSIFMGSRFSTTLLEVNGVGKALQIYSQEEILSPIDQDKKTITSIKISTQSDAVRLGVFSIYSIALIPEDYSKTIPPYGYRYVSRIPASGNLDPRTVANTLYNTKFKIKDSGVTAVYLVEPNSVKPIHLKKFSGNIPLV